MSWPKVSDVGYTLTTNTALTGRWRTFKLKLNRPFPGPPTCTLELAAVSILSSERLRCCRSVQLGKEYKTQTIVLVYLSISTLVFKSNLWGYQLIF